jgi:selenoprotein W-related protein
VSLVTEILKEFESRIASLELIPSDGGCFEVAVDGELIFSKRAAGRHAATGEVVQAIRERLSG